MQLKNFCLIRARLPRENGFTLIELLVTLGILSLLSGILILYTRGSEGQIKILKDKAVFISALYRAKSFALNTVQGDGKTCGYGMRIIDESQLVVWRDITEKKCAESNHVYDGEVENVGAVVALSPGIIFRNISEPDFLRGILFIPPDPQVVTDPAVPQSEQFHVVLGTRDGRSETTIGINRFGQVEPAIGY